MLLSVAEGLTGTNGMQDKEKQISDLTAKLRDKKLPDKVRDKLNSTIHLLKTELGLTPPGSNSEQDMGTDGAGENADSAECELRGELVDRWPHFKETYMVSSLTGDGVESLKVPPTHN